MYLYNMLYDSLQPLIYNKFVYAFNSVLAYLCI